ncbi:MAG TPA: tetratricopeptide repeat protein [Acidobacteriaceae bacterium]|jgi:Flp pilus assembly protein TadD/mono/diheme cytochrome c family protein|nr:tetratricopeptide repeat protein [Acidobacteriaceae bacterium]
MRILLPASLALFACIAVGFSPWRAAVRAAETPVTWSRHIAPIVYRNCAACHHLGGPGPFSLLSYADGRRHGQQILDVTQSRYMPPWLPAPGYGDFAGERRLSAEDLALIRRWVTSGMAEGNPADAPPEPHFGTTWQMGKPDLILSVNRPWTLPGSGADTFRNFVLPYPLAQTHFIRAMEIRPGTPQVVHHANILIDRTASYRHEHPDWKDGVAGMELELDGGNTFDPDSHFLFWKPDTPVLEEPNGMPWRLDPGNDLILNMHLKPSGKPETIDAQIGLYFTDKPPTRHPMLLQLEDDRDLDIPAGARDFVAHDEFTLPIDVELLGIYPHAHYLGRELEAWAILPEGKKKWLIRIPSWDIDRQAVYRYRAPVLLPHGTVIHMHYVYDNSDQNIHNPNSPPLRVRAGNRSVDEMAHLWLQVLPINVPKGSPDPRLLLEQAWMEHRLHQQPGDSVALYNLASAEAGLGHNAQAIAAYRAILRDHPDDLRSLNSVGVALESTGNGQEAEQAFRQAIAAGPGSCDPRFNLASLDLKQSKFQDAEPQFRTMLAHCPNDVAAHNGLGIALAAEGNNSSAQSEFKSALALNPQDFTAQYQLGEIAIAAGRPADAIDFLSAASKERPEDIDTRQRLAMAFAQSGRPADALAQLRESERLSPKNVGLHALLSQVLAGMGQLQQAIDEQDEALRLQPQDPDGWNNLGVLEARIGKTSAARADFQQALQLAPKHAQARANLSQLPPQ